ncbi:MAG: DUF3604 domain-containing protein [Woeseiaceae bacterium]
MISRNSGISLRAISCLATCLALVACGSENSEHSAGGTDPAVATSSPTTTTGTAAYPTNAYFGDTHVHTGWSGDAGMDGAITEPEDAYRYALGEVMTSNTGLEVQLSRPYDWFMVTDHSDGMGTINEIVAENPEMMADPVLARWSKALKSSEEEAAAAKSELVVMQSQERLPAPLMDPKWMASAWAATIKTAEEFYRPGEFTTFIAYEWTVNANGGNNLHRNVIYRDGAARASTRLPLTTFETQDPEKLWEWMEEYEAETGGRLLAIPHNGNLSNGRMFEQQRFDGTPLTSDWAQQREKYERLYEVSQIKGQSETHPALSTNDEFASWDLWDSGNLILIPKEEGQLEHEYWRQALASGLRLESELGTNPFKYGANAASDTHTGFSSTEENQYLGKFKTLEPRADRWDFPVIEGPTATVWGWEQAASGIMGVWATENTREAIWDAMHRRETFATTGPRMKLRFFGGYDLSDADVDGDFVAAGYERGVPMGGDLSAAPDGAALTFILSALKDAQGANLDRLQVVKGWVDENGQTQEAIHDVVWSDGRQPDSDGKLPAVGNTVDLETATYENSIGATQLIGVFRDSDFDPAVKSVYYMRVLEIPTPRWTLYDKVHLGAEPDADVPLIHQERGFSSPIWYTP